MADVYALTDAQRADILALDRAAATRMATSYSEILTDATRRLDQLQLQIQESGGTPTRHALFQEARYLDLVNQLQAGMTLFSRVAEGATQDAIRQALSAFDQEAFHAATFGKGPIEIGSSGFATVPWEALNSMIAFTATGMPLRDLFTAANAQGLDDAIKTMTSGLLRGLPARVVAANLKAALGIPMLRAMTIARTELLRSYREAQRLSILANPEVYEGWVWRAALNARTCGICWTMHGTLYPITDGKLTGSMPGTLALSSGRFPPGLTVAPMETHPNCRCVLSPRPKSYAEILNDPTIPDRRLPMVPGSSLFSNLPFDRQRAILGPGRHDLYLQGVPLTEMLGRVGNRTWGDMIRMKPLRELAPAQLGVTAMDLAPGKVWRAGDLEFRIVPVSTGGYWIEFFDPKTGAWRRSPEWTLIGGKSLLTAQMEAMRIMAKLQKPPTPAPQPTPPPPKGMTVAELAAARKDAGVTATALAKEMGISTTYLAKLEASGRMRPDLEVKYRAALSKITNGKLGGAEPGGSGSGGHAVPAKGPLTAAQVDLLFGKLSNAELAKLLQVSITRIYRMRKEGVSEKIADRLRSVLGTKGGGVVAPPPAPVKAPTPPKPPAKTTLTPAEKLAAKEAAALAKAMAKRAETAGELATVRDRIGFLSSRRPHYGDPTYAAYMAERNALYLRQAALEKALRALDKKIQSLAPLEQRLKYSRPTAATHGSNWEVAARIYDDSLDIIRELEKLFPGLKSRWTGQIQIEVGKGSYAAYFSWSNYLGITTKTIGYSQADLRKVLIHEYLHSISPKLVSKHFRTANGLGFEEGVVERMTQLLERRIALNLGWPPVTGYNTYGHYTRPLVGMAGALGMDELAFFQLLMNTPYIQREAVILKMAEEQKAAIAAAGQPVLFYDSGWQTTAYYRNVPIQVGPSNYGIPYTPAQAVTELDRRLGLLRGLLRYTQEGSETYWAKAYLDPYRGSL